MFIFVCIFCWGEIISSQNSLVDAANGNIYIWAERGVGMRESLSPKLGCEM